MKQEFDKRNSDIKIFVNDGLYNRNDAKISVFDSVVQGGDAVWEGLRVYKEGILLFDRHLDRMYDSAKALAFENIPEKSTIKTAVFDTLKANNMFDDAHIRLTLTRGEKITSGMDPRLNTNGCGLIVLAEFKSPVYEKSGISIITSAIRRNNPQFLDSKIHHNNLLNNIQAKIQANVAGVDDALMLDDNGFVSELNGTNIFMCKNNIVYTPTTDSCLPGITREMVIENCRNLKFEIIEKNISLTDLYSASEVFTTGTMGELVPINYIDGRQIENTGNMFPQINEQFIESIPDHCHPID